LATGYPLPQEADAQADLVRGLHRLGLAGIGIKLDRHLPALSQTVIDTSEDLGFPLILIPEQIHLDDILYTAFSTIANRQAAALERTREIHDRFLSVTLSGGGLGELCQELSGLLGDASVLITDQFGATRANAGAMTTFVELGLIADGQTDDARLRTGQ